MKPYLAAVLVVVSAGFAAAGPAPIPPADVVVLGEIHDNPASHATQAGAVAMLAPKALVFEMLTEAQAAKMRDDLIDAPEKLAEALGWADTGWPDFSLYAPIFVAGRGAKVYGAEVPRDRAQVALKIGVPVLFGEDAAAYGLTEEPGADELAERLNLQMAAHCGALPLDLLPGMVDLQRLRDAMLARTALKALDETGGPVAVITGNGHARKDWGVPSYIARVAPQVSVFALGQGEDGAMPEGGFDIVLNMPAVDREDPCNAFK